MKGVVSKAILRFIFSFIQCAVNKAFQQMLCIKKHKTIKYPIYYYITATFDFRLTGHLSGVTPGTAVPKVHFGEFLEQIFYRPVALPDAQPMLSDFLAVFFIMNSN